jgi:hypothetical protein
MDLEPGRTPETHRRGGSHRRPGSRVLQELNFLRAAQLKQRYKDLEIALNKAMESVPTFGVPDAEKTSKLPGEEISANLSNLL